MKSMMDYLPDQASRGENVFQITARVPEALAERVRKELKERNMSWVDFVTGACLLFLDECAERKTKK